MFSKHRISFGLLLVALGTSFFYSCSEEEVVTPANTTYSFSESTYTEAAVQEAMINMEDGDTIHFEAGTYTFTSTLSIEGKSNVVLRGSGRTNTTFDFSGQSAGAQGIYASDMDWFLMMDFTILDAIGDGIKAKDCNGITFLRVGTIYSNDADPDNGAYGLYPVTSQNVLMDDCYVKGASDAGIYVGQSEQVIVRNCLVEGNVAGIEVENCINADVYGNTAQYNTGGLLVFDLPGLAVIRNGHTTRLYNNTLISNDLRNFAPSGNIVSNVPPGTGIMILGAGNVEIFDNTLTNNNVMGIGLISYTTFTILDPGSATTDTLYNPFIWDIHIHDNTFSTDDVYPQQPNTIGSLLMGLFPSGDIGDIVYDGMLHPDNATDITESICIHSNGNATYCDVDSENFFASVVTDMSIHNCTQPAIAEVTVNAPTGE